jgi:hypothetical protein
MKFMSIRDLRNETTRLQRTLPEEAVALMSNGKPFGLVIDVGDEDDIAELERDMIRLRAERAVSRIRKRARALGLDRMTMDEIDAEIQAARAERKR